MKVLCLIALALLAVSEAAKLKPVAKVGFSTTGSKVSFELDATDSKGDIDSYKWELLSGFDKGRVIEHPKVTYTTTSFEPHKWQLTVCEEGGKCKSKVSKTPDLSNMKVDPPVVLDSEQP